jgi:Sulfite exporter TauE/SafE
MIIAWQGALLALGAGLVIAAISTPVGVSGAVFLLPVQLSVLQVPSPSVTPTNLLFNVVAGPGGLLRYRTFGRLTRLLLAGTLPGVIAGAIIRLIFAVVVPLHPLATPGCLVWGGASDPGPGDHRSGCRGRRDRRDLRYRRRLPARPDTREPWYPAGRVRRT